MHFQHGCVISVFFGKTYQNIPAFLRRAWGRVSTKRRIYEGPNAPGGSFILITPLNSQFAKQLEDYRFSIIKMIQVQRCASKYFWAVSAFDGSAFKIKTSSIAGALASRSRAQNTGKKQHLLPYFAWCTSVISAPSGQFGLVRNFIILHF